MRVIGTAGHVDHGKSTLVEALTGTHPDRLKEEQAREMTIELGFGWMTLPGGEDVGIVDVPGHRDFIENMLAGVGGIDAVLFVVAADEGVMPQTREHLAILDLLQIQGGVIVLTKIDMVDDPEWLELVESDVRQAMIGTVLEDAPLVRVSARTGAGMDTLKQALAACLAGREERADYGRARLPIDRVFTIAGFGTVVTGTLSDGRLRVGDEVEVLPQGLRGRVRGLQTHKRKEDTAVPGSRTAVNISGINLEQVQRGNVLAAPGRYRPTARMDVRFRLLADASAALKHNSEVKFFIGTSEIQARVRLLGVDELRPGEEGWLQLELSQPAVAVRGDRYILRRPSPAETLGGGSVVDPHPARRHKRFDESVLNGLAALLQGTPEDVILQAAQALGPAAVKELAGRSRLVPDVFEQALGRLVQSGDMLALENGELRAGADVLVVSRARWESETQKALRELEMYHRQNVLRRGMAREELKSRLKMTPRLFNAALRTWVAAGLVTEIAALVARSGFHVQLSPAQRSQVERLMERFAAAPYAPPTIKECQMELGEELFGALLDEGRLVSVSSEVVFRREDYDALRQAVQAHFETNETMTVAEFRDRFNTSRRYALAFLEHLDASGVTVRDGDTRRLRKGR